MEPGKIIGDILLIVAFLVLLNLLLRRWRHLAGNTQESSKKTACDYHKWGWDEKIRNYRCQNKNCDKIAGHNPP